MSTRHKRPLTTAEQLLRWIGLAAILGAIVLSVAGAEGAVAVLGVVLLFASIGCYITLAVLAYQRRRR